MKYISTLLLVWLSCSVSAQQKNDIIVTAGVGIDNIRLGMTEEEVRAILPGEHRTTNFMEELAEFRNFDKTIRVDSMVQFVMGFDKMIAVSDEAAKELPVYNLGFKEGKLNYISVSSYIEEEGLAERVLLNGSIRMHMPEAGCRSVLGDDFLPIRYREYTDHVYYNQGVEVMYDEGKLRCLIIFEKTPDYLKKIQKNSTETLRLFNSLPEVEEQ